MRAFVAALLVLAAWYFLTRGHPTPAITTPAITGKLPAVEQKPASNTFRLAGISPAIPPAPAPVSKEVIEIEDVLFGPRKNPEMIALVKEINDRMVDRLDEKGYFIDACMRGVKGQPGQIRFEWDDVVEVEGDGETMTITDYSSENWPAEFSDIQKRCWEMLFVGHSWPSEKRASLLISIGAAYGIRSR